MIRNKVYTSFDGDNMLYIDIFRDYVITQGKIPLNPTHALGYYISTIEHNNSKKLAMQDCCTVELLCDEFWIFTNSDRLDIDQLPEGVIIELLVWLHHKGSGFIRVLDINKVMNTMKERSYIYDGESVYIDHDYIKNNLEREYYKDLIRHIPDFNALREPVFIDIESEKFKYVDWVKSYTFKKKKVPIVAHCVIPHTVYQLYNKLHIYKEDLETLRSSIQQKWEIRKNKSSKVNQHTTITFSEVGIPKYANAKEWALTNREYEESSG